MTLLAGTLSTWPRPTLNSANAKRPKIIALCVSPHHHGPRSHQIVVDLAKHATVPVINGPATSSTLRFADLLMIQERMAGYGPAMYIGDGNNVAS